MTPRVLIVDDSTTVRMSLVELFAANDCDPVPAADLASARERLASETIDAVVLDVLLPDGDGVDLLSEIRRSDRPQLPVVMLSTESEVESRVRALERGADDYVGKPYDEHNLVARVRALAATADDPEAPPTVLIIDDSATFRAALSACCRRAGYGVIEASDGLDGVRRAALRRPAVVLVDRELPGVDGVEVVRQLRADASLRATLCVLITGHDDTAHELEAYDAGADAFIPKGTSPNVVVARLDALVRQRVDVPRLAVSGVLAPKRLLAVDDSVTFLHATADRLRSRGFDVVTAESGEQALRALEVEHVDCVLLDMVMPDLGGIDVCRRIKSTRRVRDVPVVMLTSHDDDQSMVEALGAGADDFIAKSGQFEVLEARIRAQLRRKQFEDEHRRTRDELLRSELEAADARAANDLAETRARLVAELERKNAELEAFNYTVSHDLRAPLRTIREFSADLLRRDEVTDDIADDLARIHGGAVHMTALIEALLSLAQIERAPIVREPVDFGALVEGAFAELRHREPTRAVTTTVACPESVYGDPRLLRTVVENLVANAWKFTRPQAAPHIEVLSDLHDDITRVTVRDDGVGFDEKYAHELFRPFRRLHTAAEFPGTGIGLASARRIVERHGGEIGARRTGDGWTEFWFTVPPIAPWEDGS